MPHREAKGRMLVREYMADREFMRTFTPDERETYLLLSLFTDDAGWLNWDVGELAAAMFRYEDVDAREDKVTAHAMHFKSTGRLTVYKCGHAVMPKVANRPRGMAREYAVRDAHTEKCKSTRSASGVRVRSALESSRPPNHSIPNHSVTSTEPNVEVITPRAPRGRAGARGGKPSAIGETLSEFQAKVPRPGGDLP